MPEEILYRRLEGTTLSRLPDPTKVARYVRDRDQQRWRRCVGSNPLAPTTFRASKRLAYEPGVSFRAVGVGLEAPSAATWSLGTFDQVWLGLTLVGAGCRQTQVPPSEGPGYMARPASPEQAEDAPGAATQAID